MNDGIPFGTYREPDHQANGFKVELLHSGQKRAYGDRYTEYRVISGKPEDEVLDYCTESVCRCTLSYDQWVKENREKPSMDNHFRSHFNFRKTGDGEYFYQIIFPFTD